MERLVIGLDFGTESARAVLVDVSTGGLIATAVHPYADGVIDRALPGGGPPLGRDWALQNPSDWLSALEATVRAVVEVHSGAAESIIGLGVAFTACTVLPTTAEGTPLCSLEGYREQPHAWAKLWKHHAAQPQADRVNELGQDRNEPWLRRHGGKISSEWLMPKALQLLDESPELYAAAELIIEGGDWVAWQLSGKLARNACAAGYKATWHKAEGFPSTELLQALHPSLTGLYTSKLQGPVVSPGEQIGGLTVAWAERLGLRPGTPVAAPIIDAHSAAIGGGVSEPGVMFMMMGTSTCHMLMAESELPIEGIAGVVEDGILPGLFGYEAGQAGVGDMFAWFVENSVPPPYHEAAAARDLTLHQLLIERAAELAPGESGLLALDWWAGNRSTLVDADLTGLLVGLTLATRAEQIYRALMEATAFGTRVIVEAFTEPGLPVNALVTGGGLTQNPLLMQIYADVIGREIAVTGAEQASAMGAAMLGAAAAGQAAGGYDSLREASQRMAAPPVKVYLPDAAHQAQYDLLYQEYRRLYDLFGRGQNDLMKRLRRAR